MLVRYISGPSVLMVNFILCRRNARKAALISAAFFRTLLRKFDVGQISNVLLFYGKSFAGWSGQIDADDSLRLVLDGFFENDFVLLEAEHPVHHQNDSRFHLRILESRFVQPPNR